MNTLVAFNTLIANMWMIVNSVTEGVFFVTILVLLILILIVSIVLYRAVTAALRLSKPVSTEEKQHSAKPVPEGSFWKNLSYKILGLKSKEEEKKLLMEDHEFDGIQELDYPVPAWFNILFYSTVVFAVVYLLVYHVFGWGMLQEEEYEHEMAIAQQQREEYLASSENNIDENTVVVDLAPETVSAGEVLFTANCAACHGSDGGGTIGPNLADDYWIHGGNVGDVFHTIKYGVLDKGMIAWEESLTPSEIAQVSNYIVSLRGSTPASPKAPEGELFEYTDMDGQGTAEDVVDQMEEDAPEVE